MPKISLPEMLRPETSVLLTQELQGGVVGPSASLPVLAEEARREALPNAARLVDAAHHAGVQVIHCLVEERPNGKALADNCALFRMGQKMSGTLLPGSEGATLLPELGPHPDDIVLRRVGGLGPMANTELDSVLRNLGARVIVLVGVSVNVAITNCVMDSVNRGYQVVLPRDAVAGVPKEYADAVIDNTLALLTEVVATDDVVAAWRA